MVTVMPYEKILRYRNHAQQEIVFSDGATVVIERPKV
ncbi:MAG: hypothetical protein JWP10_267 [Nocardioidaceae bacterium]|nr:hypothetical protein [Nocardioidaceae bacterium]